MQLRRLEINFESIHGTVQLYCNDAGLCKPVAQALLCNTFVLPQHLELCSLCSLNCLVLEGNYSLAVALTSGQLFGRQYDTDVHLLHVAPKTLCTQPSKQYTRLLKQCTLNSQHCLYPSSLRANYGSDLFQRLFITTHLTAPSVRFSFSFDLESSTLVASDNLEYLWHCTSS